MKRYIAGTMIILLLATFCWAQGTKSTFDAKKSREELEIMKGILGTTLSFIIDDSRSQASRWRYSNISAFYLAGQGAVFVVPSSTLRGPGFAVPFNFNFGDLSQSLAALNKEVAEISSQAAQQATAAAASALAQRSPDTGNVPPPAPPAPAPPNPPQINREELRKKIEAYQEKAKKAREAADENRQKLFEKLREAKGLLLETLANYGDSMTTVKPGEYVNLVLMIDSVATDAAGLTENVHPWRQEVISVQKSWITEYKTGKLTLDAFKQKALQYNE